MAIIPKFTPRQARDAQEVIGNIIRQRGVTARVFRSTLADSNSFYGPRESAENFVCETTIEPRVLTPENLAELGADLVAGALPDADIREGDILEVEGVRYRVTHLDPNVIVGLRTHVELFLERSQKDAVQP